jgi:DNA-binding NarL/FixJ family response regulator
MKQEGPDKMRDAITKVLNGQVYASERTAAAILDALSRPRSSESTSTVGKLTDRELEVLRLTGQGKDNRAIAQELHISLKTVDTHRGHIKEKLGLKNGTELIHYAVRWVGEQV